MLRRSALSLSVLLAACLVGFAPTSASAADMDCGDFATQAAAQAFFLQAGAGDPHRLDSDGDRVACESNPCPCSTQVVPFAGPTTAAPTQTAEPSSINPDGSGNSGPTRRDRGNVVRVSDGDTLTVRLRNGRKERVRIIGIDTPEVYGGRECGGRQASARMKKMAPAGSTVKLVSDPSQADRDRYGRLLRYVHRGRRDLGKRQVATGHAQVFVYRNDPFRRAGAYQRAERQAKAKKLASWQRCWR